MLLRLNSLRQFFNLLSFLALKRLKNSRNEFNRKNIWKKAKFISQNVKSWIKKDGQENEEIQFNEL